MREIDIGNYKIPEFVLSDIERTQPGIANKIYELSVVRDLLDSDDKLSKIVDCLIDRYLKKTEYSGFYVKSENLTSSRIFNRRLNKKSEIFDEILQKDFFNQLYNASVDEFTFGSTKILYNDDLGTEYLPRNESLINQEMFSLIGYGFSKNVHGQSYDRHNMNKDESKQLIKNLKRALNGKKIKAYGVDIEGKRKR